MSRNTTTLFGLGNEEMCYSFLRYYPKDNIPAPVCTSSGEIDLCKTYTEYSEHFPNGIDGCNLTEYYTEAGGRKVMKLLSKV